MADKQRGEEESSDPKERKTNEGGREAMSRRVGRK